MSSAPNPQQKDLSGSRHFFVYFGVSFVPVLILALVMSRSVRSESNRLVLLQSQSNVRTLVSSVIEANVGTMKFSDGLVPDPTNPNGITEERLASIRRSTTAMLASKQVFLFRLRDLSGNIVFDASEPDNLKKRTDNPLEGRELGIMLDGVAESQLTSITEAGFLSENASTSTWLDPATQAKVRSIESYMPVRSGGTVVGIAEVFLPYEPIRQAVDTSENRLLRNLTVGLPILWLVLGIIVRGTTRRFQKAVAHHRYVARHDVLTGLPNRVEFREDAEAAISAARESQGEAAIAIIDLNGFKEINDTLGHHNGDHYLRYVAGVLEGAAGDHAKVSRLGGDEFGVVLPDARGDQVRQLSERIQTALRIEIDLDSVPVSTEASIGIARWPHDGDDIDQLMRNADAAMYAAKEGRLGTLIYHEALSHNSHSRLEVYSEVRKAIAKDELTLFYQPKVSMKTGRVESVEALVRWNHPTRGLLPPSEFLPVVESSSLIDNFSKWVIRRAVQQIVEWSIAPGAPRIAVNLSTRNLRDDSIVTYIEATLREFRVHPSWLVVEITETDYLDNPDTGIAVLKKLRAIGVHTSLDDFGQGYTSLGHLTTLPVSELKIDRAFITAMLSDPKSRAIVESVIELGHKLGLYIVAEGVEHVEELQLLTALGCDSAQGYLHSRPLPAADFIAWLSQRQPTGSPFVRS